MEADDEEKEDDDDADEADILNEAIARTEEERALFRQMDIDRRRAEEGAWVSAGNTGKLYVLYFLRSISSEHETGS